MRRFAPIAGVLFIFYQCRRLGFTAHARGRPAREIQLQEEQHRLRGMIGQVPWHLACICYYFGALLSLVLWSAQRRRLEYLYLGM